MTLSIVSPDLTIDECIPVVEQAFRDLGEGRLSPPKTLGMHTAAGTFHVKTAIADVFAAKINANFPGNPGRYALPTVQGVIVIFDLERGTPIAVMDGSLITTLRTAAATAVAAKFLAREDAKTLAVIGYGTQGRAHVEAIRRVRTLEKVYTLDLGDPIDAAVADADIVVTCTPSTTPILDARHLHPGLFIAGVGADNPEKHELSPELLRRSRVFADLLEQAATLGDLHHAIEAGVLRREDVAGELADVVCGRAGRRTEDEVIVFDSTGTAIQDVVTAQLALRKAPPAG